LCTGSLLDGANALAGLPSSAAEFATESPGPSALICLIACFFAIFLTFSC
jgi:hypothetical protein